MADEATRKEILDLLARGKITVDEAAAMLTGDAPLPPREPQSGPQSGPQSEPQAAAEAIPVEEEAPAAKAEVEQQAAEPATKAAPAAARTEARDNGQRPTWFRVRVSDLETGKRKVAVNIPLGMVKFGLRMANRYTPESERIDLDEMSEMVMAGERGILVDVEDDESNEHVQIYLE